VGVTWHGVGPVRNTVNFQCLTLLVGNMTGTSASKILLPQQFPNIYFGKPTKSDHEEFRKNGLVKQIQSMWYCGHLASAS